MVQYRFRTPGCVSPRMNGFSGGLPRITGMSLKDLTNDHSYCVHPETSLAEMAEIVISEKSVSCQWLIRTSALNGQVNVP